jgi:hypothetical protein
MFFCCNKTADIVEKLEYLYKLNGFQYRKIPAFRAKMALLAGDRLTRGVIMHAINKATQRSPW